MVRCAVPPVAQIVDASVAPPIMTAAYIDTSHTERSAAAVAVSPITHVVPITGSACDPVEQNPIDPAAIVPPVEI